MYESQITSIKKRSMRNLDKGSSDVRGEHNIVVLDSIKEH
jgi:hypothetical protein